MKTLYFVGGTMGVGKTAVCRALKGQLDRAVFLDGDWCWDAHPFTVTEETKKMVVENIAFLLNQFLGCSAYENVIFCWVMHRQPIVDDLLSRLQLTGVQVKNVSLVCTEETLRERLQQDIQAGIRTPDVLARSVERIPLYGQLNTVKITTDGKEPEAIAAALAALKGEIR